MEVKVLKMVLLEGSDDEKSDAKEEEKISHKEARNVKEIAIKHVEHQLTGSDVQVIKKWWNYAFRYSLKVNGLQNFSQKNLR